MVAWVVVLCAAMAGCLIGDRAERESTETHLRIIASFVDSFWVQTGRWPARLDDLCGSVGTHLCEGGSKIKERSASDGWERSLTYVPLDAGFELRSRGPDGELGNSDDVVLNRQVDRARVRELAGCFEAREGWWRGLSASLRLDTLPNRTGPTGYAYHLWPEDFGEPKGRGRAEWYPVSGDSLVLWWERFPHLWPIRLTVDGDTLRGQVAFSDPPWRGSVLLIRVSCDSMEAKTRRS